MLYEVITILTVRMPIFNLTEEEASVLADGIAVIGGDVVFAGEDFPSVGQDSDHALTARTGGTAI